ncbi:MAG: ATP-binding cassette domain-containing protein [Sporolactobacillus sp.]
MIDVVNLCFNYQTYERRSGINGGIQDFFHRQTVQKAALSDVSFTIHDGEIVGLLGKNGAGKTTLTKILTGLVHPSSGQVCVDGFVPYEKKSEFLMQIGLVLGQKSQLNWDLPAMATLHLLKAIYHLSDSNFDSRLAELLHLLGLEALIDTPVRKLSLGERMKFDLTCALLHRPKVLFLDEPTIGLDWESQQAIHTFLKTVNEQQGTTIMLTSHYMKDIEALAGRILMLSKGELVIDKTVDALLRQYSGQTVLSLLTGEKRDFSYPGTDVRVTDRGMDIVFAADSAVRIDEVLRALQQQDIVIESVSTSQLPLEDILYDVYQKGSADV